MKLKMSLLASGSVSTTLQEVPERLIALLLAYDEFCATAVMAMTAAKFSSANFAILVTEIFICGSTEMRI
jgi:hypothetical protein